ncbi:Protein ECM18 [Spathaspora sp. JA1]|nr:Protein ECM18 [Spathaspora sp. JA1]
MKLILFRSFSNSHWLRTGKTQFVIPSWYKPNRNIVKKLPFKLACKIWINSLKSNQLESLQSQLVELMLPTTHQENQGIIRQFKQVKLDSDNYINEVGFKIVNSEKLPTKHIVFIHGYGASLGCFARNFQLINKFKSSKQYNYHIHFLDNITFGLSSNPKVNNPNIRHNWIIPKCAPVTMIDNNPNTKLYKKYYKLIEGFEVNPEEFTNYKQQFVPILQDLETFYTQAIDSWRQRSGIEKIDFLIGHSYGGYWSGSYALKYPNNLKNLILLSPVGVERHVHAVTHNTTQATAQTPSLDPTSYNFLTRLPILSTSHVRKWYNLQPFLPKLLKFLGPWGVQTYFSMWMNKLFKINKLIEKNGGVNKVFTNNNDLIYGKKKEIKLIIEYLYNSITNGTNSDTYIKYLLTPATVSKWPLYDKFIHTDPTKINFNINFIYGQFDFMNVEAGEKLVNKLKETSEKSIEYSEVSEGGHNLYIDNPFETNQKIFDIVMKQEK